MKRLCTLTASSNHETLPPDASDKRSLDLTTFRLLAFGILVLAGCSTPAPARPASPSSSTRAAVPVSTDFNPLSVRLTDVMNSSHGIPAEFFQKSIEQIELKESHLRRLRIVMAGEMHRQALNPQSEAHFNQEKLELELETRRLTFDLFYNAGVKLSYSQVNFPQSEDADYFRRIVVGLEYDPGKLNGYLAEKIALLEDRLRHLRSMLYLCDVDERLDPVEQQVQREEIVRLLVQTEQYLQLVHNEFHRGIRRK